MFKENMIQHIKDAREIEKRNIFGMYILSLCITFFWAIIAIAGYHQYVLPISYLIAMGTSFVYSILYLKRHEDSIEAKTRTLGLSYLFVCASFQILAIYIITSNIIRTSISLSVLLNIEFIVILIMALFLFRTIYKGIQQWQMVVTTILGGATPIAIILLTQTVVFDGVNNDFTAVILVYTIGILFYPVMDGGLKTFYMNYHDMNL